MPSTIDNTAKDKLVINKEIRKMIAEVNFDILRGAWKKYVGNLSAENNKLNFYQSINLSSNQIGDIYNKGIFLSDSRIKRFEETTGLKREIIDGKSLMTISIVDNENLDINNIKQYFILDKEMKLEWDGLILKAINNIHVDVPANTDLYKWCYFIKNGQPFTGLGAEEYKLLSEEERQSKIACLMQDLGSLTKYEWIDLNIEQIEKYKKILETQLCLIKTVYDFKKL